MKALNVDGKDIARTLGRMRRTSRLSSGDGERRRLVGMVDPPSPMVSLHFSIETLRVSAGGKRVTVVSVVGWMSSPSSLVAAQGKSSKLPQPVPSVKESRSFILGAAGGSKGPSLSSYHKSSGTGLWQSKVSEMDGIGPNIL